MESRGSEDKFKQYGIFTYLLVVVLLAIVALLLYTSSSQRYSDFQASQQEMMKDSASDALSVIEIYVEQTRRQVSLFAAAEQELIADLVMEPDNLELIEKMDSRLARYIPDYFAFTITDSDGNVFLDDFEGKVGEVCLADIQSFSDDGHSHELVIHPNPLQYHFDLMSTVDLGNNEQGIFFVSFKPDVLATHIANNEIHGHRLLLIHAEQEGLIELSSDGSRDVLGASNRLTQSELAQVNESYPVPGTLWKLVYLPDLEYFASVQEEYRSQSLNAFLLVFTFSIISMLIIRFEEIKRRTAEQALQQSHDQLETKVKLRTRELEQSENRYALAARGVNDGIWEWEADSVHIYVSSRWRKIAGVSHRKKEYTLSDWLDLIEMEDRELFEAAFHNATSGVEDHIEISFRFMRKEGSCYCLCRAAVETDETGYPVRMAGSITDITQQKRAEQQLQHHALHDSLTQLPNRNLFIDRLSQAMDTLQRRSDFHYAVMRIDLDRFKEINENLGHLVGDQLLIIVAERIQSVLHPEDTLARLGTNEYAMLIYGYESIGRVTDTAEQILARVAEPYSVEGELLTIGAHVGISLGTYQYESPDDVLRDSGIAMYRAVAQGKNDYFIFNENVRREVLSRVHTETLLGSAIKYQQLKIYYQPVIRLDDGSLHGFEALLRWQHPEKGLLLPEEFIPLAEESGLIVPIGHWVLEMACRQIKAWQDTFPQHSNLSLSVNLSAMQFEQAELVSQVESLLRETSLEKSAVSIGLEVTETVLMQNASCSTDIMNEIKQLGVQLSIDDFGTGYSSLAYLQRFPVDVLKIDQQFVSMIDVEADSLNIVRTVVELARSMGMKVIAEGVETGTQHKLLVEMGCDYAQGFYYSQAVSADNARTMLAENREWQHMFHDNTSA